jgi:glycosyltransferase involved in cell wall biosynthesis
MHKESSVNAPLVSVCIPTYNGEGYLDKAINSVLAQTCGDFELVVIDNTSQDLTDAVLARYRDPRIRYLKNSHNLGPESNFNRCLEEARGVYFKLLPHDDLLYPDALERQVEILERDTECGISIVFGSRVIIDSQGKPITWRGIPFGRTGRISGNDLVRLCVRHGTNLIGEPGGVLMRKSTADKVGKFDASIPYVVDLDYWVRLLAHGDGYYLRDPLSAFRITSGSWSIGIGRRQQEEYRKFIKRISMRSELKLGSANIAAGMVMAGVNTLLRMWFYRFFVKTQS